LIRFFRRALVFGPPFARGMIHYSFWVLTFTTLHDRRLCIRQESIQCRNNRGIHHCCSAQSTLPVVPLAGQYVPLARLAADNLATSRFGKSFARS